MANTFYNFITGITAFLMGTNLNANFDKCLDITETGTTQNIAGALTIVAPTANLNPTTKLYVDNGLASKQTLIDAKVSKTGETMTGTLVLNGAPTQDLHAATKKYVDDNKTVGQYQGSGASSKTIDTLGFTPSAVLIQGQHGSTTQNPTYRIYGGLAVTGFPLKKFDGTIVAAEIVPGGFKVYNNTNNLIYVNDSSTYYNYIAFK